MPPRFDLRPIASDHFSWIRTHISIERTLLAWVRTAFALIGFGFTIVQFFERMTGSSQAAVATFPDAPRYLGVALISMGVLSLLVTIFEYHSTIKYISIGEFAVIAGSDGLPSYMPLYAVAVGLCLIGIFCLSAVTFRLL